MTIGVGNSVFTTGGGTSVASTGIGITNGSTIVVYCALTTNTTVVSVVDSSSNTYNQIGTTTVNFGTTKSMWYATNVTGGGSVVVTVTWANGASNVILVAEITGADSASLDQSKDQFDSGSTPWLTDTTSATTQNDEMAIAAFFDSRGSGTETFTWNNGYTSLVEHTDSAQPVCAMAYKILSTTGTQQGSVSFAGADHGLGYIATFKQAAGGGGGAVPSIGSAYRIGNWVR